jgi:hypothetical protein
MQAVFDFFPRFFVMDKRRPSSATAAYHTRKSEKIGKDRSSDLPSKGHV